MHIRRSTVEINGQINGQTYISNPAIAASAPKSSFFVLDFDFLKKNMRAQTIPIILNRQQQCRVVMVQKNFDGESVITVIYLGMTAAAASVADAVRAEVEAEAAVGQAISSMSGKHSKTVFLG